VYEWSLERRQRAKVRNPERIWRERDKLGVSVVVIEGSTATRNSGAAPIRCAGLPAQPIDLAEMAVRAPMQGDSGFWSVR